MIRVLALFLALIISGPAAPAETTRPMAVNLAPVNDWSAQQPFIDVMKTARRWIGHKPRQWGGMSFQELEARGIFDAQGWPTEIPDDLASIGTLILTDLPEGAQIYAGRYVLRYEGKGIVEVAGAVRNLRYGKNQVAFDFTPGGMVILKLQRTDPARTGDYIRNITVVKASHEAAFQQGGVFNPDWLPIVEGFEVLRFMDWMVTNDSDQQGWDQRPKVDDFSYSRHGVPAEVMIRLANRLDAAPWFCMPHLSDDNYQRRFAQLVRAQLEPDLPVYVEYSNEVWNWQFDTAAWAERQCQARWGAQDCWVQYYGLRAAEVADIWTDVFGAEARDRLTRVITTQTGWLGLEAQILDAPLVVAEGRRPPKDSFDAYAVTGYFAGGLGGDAKAPMLKDLLAESLLRATEQADAQFLTGAARDIYIAKHRFDLATENAAMELENGFVSGQTDDTLVALLGHVWPYHAAVAKSEGMTLMMYEGGTHVVANGTLINDAEVTAFFHHLNYSPQMGALYEKLIEGWAALTSAPFNAFVDVYSPNKWGSWGGLRHLGDENPRWDALAQGCKSC